MQNCRTRAAHSLPAGGAQPAGVHLAHVAHAYDADALAVVHDDCVALQRACVERGVQPMVEDSQAGSARREHFSAALA